MSKYINYTTFFSAFSYKQWTKAINGIQYIKVGHERYYLVSEVIANLERSNLNKVGDYEIKLKEKTIRIAEMLDQIGVDIDIFDNTQK